MVEELWTGDFQPRLVDSILLHYATTRTTFKASILQQCNLDPTPNTPTHFRAPDATPYLLDSTSVVSNARLRGRMMRCQGYRLHADCRKRCRSGSFRFDRIDLKGEVHELQNR